MIGAIDKPATGLFFKPYHRTMPRNTRPSRQRHPREPMAVAHRINRTSPMVKQAAIKSVASSFRRHLFTLEDINLCAGLMPIKPPLFKISITRRRMGRMDRTVAGCFTLDLLRFNQIKNGFGACGKFINLMTGLSLLLAITGAVSLPAPCLAKAWLALLQVMTQRTCPCH